MHASDVLSLRSAVTMTAGEDWRSGDADAAQIGAPADRALYKTHWDETPCRWSVWASADNDVSCTIDRQWSIAGRRLARSPQLQTNCHGRLHHRRIYSIIKVRRFFQPFRGEVSFLSSCFKMRFSSPYFIHKGNALEQGKGRKRKKKMVNWKYEMGGMVENLLQWLKGGSGRPY